ncbi:tape measure protein [Gordonia phage DatBoi]|nr:tape measure protein [Gordonia phage DatBoi]
MALSRYQAGTAWIRVTPDFTDFGNKLERQIQDNFNKTAARVKVDEKSVDQARAQLRDLGREQVSPEVKPRVSKAHVAKAEKLLDGLSDRHRQAIIDAEINSIKAEQELRTLTGRRQVEIKAELNTDSFTREFDKARREINKKLATAQNLSPTGEKMLRDTMSRALKMDAFRAEFLPAKADWEEANRRAAQLTKIIKNGGTPNDAAAKAQSKLADGYLRSAKALEAAEQSLGRVRARAAEQSAELAQLEERHAAAVDKATDAEDRKKATAKAAAWATRELTAAEKDREKILARIDTLETRRRNWEAKPQRTEHQQLTRREALTGIYQSLREARQQLTENGERISVGIDIDHLATQEAAEALREYAAAEDEVTRSKALRRRVNTQVRDAERAVRTETEKTERKRQKFDAAKAATEAGYAAEATRRRREVKAAQEELGDAEKAATASTHIYNRLVGKRIGLVNQLTSAMAGLRRVQLSMPEQSDDRARAGAALNANATRTKLTMDGAERDTALTTIKTRLPDKIANSQIDKDVVALQAAMKAAATYDRLQAQLEKRTYAVALAERHEATAQQRVNELREQGTIGTQQGVKALNDLAAAKERVAHLRRQETVASEAAGIGRRDYNAAARNLEDRANLNPIRRTIDQIDSLAGRAIAKLNDRLIFAGRLLSAVTSLGMAGVVAIGGLGAINMAPLLGSLTQMVGVLGLVPALAAAAATAVGAIAVGASGLGNAFKAAGKLAEAQAKPAPDNSKAIRNAQRGLAQAQKAQARAATQGARQIADAEESVQRAQKESRDAQRDLTRARKDARQEIDDMNRSLTGLGLSEEDAALSVEEARKNLRETLADPDADGTDRKRANLSYRQAIDNLKNVRHENARTRQEIAEANRKGVEGSDQVVSAQERAADAQASVVESQENLAQAQLDAAEASADAAERVAEAQESLAEAASGGASAVDNAAAEFEAAMAKLSPNGRGMVSVILDLRDAWDLLRKRVQDNLFQGTADDIDLLATRGLPVLQRGLSDTADQLNRGQRHILTYLSSSQGLSNLSSIFDNTAGSAGSFSIALSNGVQALITMSEVGTQFMPWFGRSLEDTTRKWRTMADQAQSDGSMEAYFARSIARTRQFGSILASTGGIIKATFEATSVMGLNSLTHLDVKLRQLREDMNEPIRQEGIRDFFQGVRGALDQLSDIGGAVGTIIVNDILPAIQMVNAVMSPIVGFIAGMSQGLSEHLPLIRTALQMYLGFRLIKGTFGLIGVGLGKLGVQVSAQTGAVGALSRGWATATATMNGYIARAGAATHATTLAGRLAGAIGGWVAPISNATQNMTRLQSAAGKLRTSMSNMLAFVGGPAGIAIGALVAGLISWYTASQEVEEANKRLEETSMKAYKAVERLDKAITAGRGDATPEVVTAATEQAEALLEQWQILDESAPGMFSKLGGFVSEAATLGKSDIFNKQMKLQLDAEDIRPMMGALKDLKINAEDIGAALSGTDENWAAFEDRLMAAGAGGIQLRDKLFAAREEIQYQRQAVADLEPGYLDLQDALGVLADTASTTTDKFDALSQAFKALLPGQEDREALKAFGEVLKDLDSQISSVTDNGGFGASQLLLDNGDLDTSKSNAIILDNAIEAGRDAIGRMQLEGRDTTDAWAQWTAKIETLGAAVGITGSDLDELLQKLYATPDRVDSVVAVQGVDKAGQDLVALRAQFADLKPGESMTKEVKLLGGEETITALRNMNAEVEPLTNGNTRITIDKETFDQDLDTTVAKIQAFSLIKAQATVDLDTESLQLNAQQSANIINILDRYKADPVARLLIEELQAKQGVALTTLQQLEDEETVPVVDANIDPLTTKIEEAKRQIRELASPFGYINRLYGKNPDGSDPTPEQIKERAAAIEKEEQESQIPAGTPGVLTPGDFATENKKKPGNYHGGRIPGFYGGGRMPLTGPGTETRDGIFAVGPDGIPRARVNGGEWVINPEMSAKYHHLLALVNADQLAGFAMGGQLPGGAPGTGGLPSLQLGAVGNPLAPLTAGVSALGAMFASALGGQALPAWAQFATQLQAGAATLINPALTAVSGQVTQIGQQFPTVSGTARAAWSAMATGILEDKTSSVDPAFDGIAGGLSTVQAAFGTSVNNIRTQWAGIRAATGDPVRFTIDSVFNGGLVGMWNSVAELIGAKPMAPYVAKFATGGVLPGYTPGRDVHRFVSPSGGELHLSGGEAIMRPEWTRAVGGPAAVERMNRDARRGVAAVNAQADGHYADGGVVSMGYGLQPGTNISYGGGGFPQWVYKLGQAHGVQASTYAGHQESDRGEAGYAPNPQGLNRGIDWSGPVPNMQRFAEYLLGVAARTPTLEQIIWQNPMTGQKIGWAGRSPDVSGSYFASDYAGHQDHVHTRHSGPMIPGLPGGSIMGLVAGQAMDMASMIREMLTPKAEEVRKNIGAKKFPGDVGQLPGQVFETAFKSMTTKAAELAEAATAYTGPAIAAGGDVERWRPMVIAALRRNGFEPNRRNQDLMLAQIQSESGGNPSAVQGVIDVNSGGNEAVGLLQIAKGTWPGVRDPSLPDDRTDPWANMNAALRYYRGKYGEDLGKMWGKGHGYDRGGIFEDGTFGFNTSGKPEAVFTNRQFSMLDELVEALLNPKMFARLTGQTPVSATGSTPAPRATEVDPEALALGETATSDALHPEVLELYKKYGLTPPGAPADNQDDPATPQAPADPATTNPQLPTDGQKPQVTNPPLPTDGSTPPVTTNPQLPTDSGYSYSPPQPDPNEPEDPLDSYNGPFADILKKGRLIGQAAHGLSSPDAMARLGDIDHDYKRAKAIKQRLTVASKYRADSQALADTLRAEGKEKEAAAIEAGITAREREIAGGDPQKLAELASLADGEAPSETLRVQAEDQFRAYLAENAVGIGESVFAAGIGATGNSGGGDIIINGGIRTNSWNDAQRRIERTQKRKSRQAARAGFR